MATVAQPISTRAEDFAATNPGALIQLCEDLIALQREGLITMSEDERGIVRYSPRTK